MVFPKQKKKGGGISYYFINVEINSFKNVIAFLFIVTISFKWDTSTNV